ncbi:MAG: DEP domain-containing protein [Acidobacteria bacterium]|nr:DEP domain-containing protein [Acidobacteriota bacterium]
MSDSELHASFDAGEARALAERLRARVDIRDRRYGFPPRVYERCFLGTDAVRALIDENIAADVADAVRLGTMLLDASRRLWAGTPRHSRCGRRYRTGTHSSGSSRKSIWRPSACRRSTDTTQRSWTVSGPNGG